MIATMTQPGKPTRRTHRLRGGPAALVVLASALMAPADTAGAQGVPAPGPSAAVTSRPVIAVADFYALVPLPILITDPERFSADDLSAMLLRAGGQNLTVLSRAEVRAAEGSLGWRTWDALKFARLGALAQALHVNRLVVGWISRLSLESSGGGPSLGARGYTVMSAVNVQVFDAAQGRIIAQHKTYGRGRNINADFAVRQSLDDALTRAVRPALSAVSAPIPNAAPSAP